jgi:cell division protease FtsH
MPMPKKPPLKPANGNRNRAIIFWALIIVFALVMLAAYRPASHTNEEAVSTVISQANKGEVSEITQTGNNLDVKLKNGQQFHSEKSPESSLKEQGLDVTKTKLTVKEPSKVGDYTVLLLQILVPGLFIFLIFYFLMRQAQGQSNQALGFGKSRARLYGNEKEKVAFDQVAGNNEAKEDLEEVVEFLKYPKKFQAVGAKIPKGVLLVGPPGTGKTLLARAVAGEANVPFFSISGSEFVEMFVGVGASRVRDLFAKAKKNAPCIIFIDEIDAVGRRRGSGMGGGHDEREQTLNQILVEMDGFEKGDNVIVLAATNRADVLDPALLRPGRFDRRVNISLPDRKDREAILRVHFKNKPIDGSVDLDSLAAKTAGTSGADLQNITNESAIIAARHNRKFITNNDVTEAFERVAIGPQRKTKVMNDHEKELTAYHEAGHALVGHTLPDSDVVHKISIIPRGGAGGVTWFIPPEDKSYHSIVEYKDVLARMLGGRIAEKVEYGADFVTTGAGSDLQKATDLAREMVIEQGMGKKLRDQVFHDEGSNMIFDRVTHSRPYSEETAQEIDGEVETLIKEAATRAEAVIRHNLKVLEKLKDALLKKETIDADEAKELMKGAVLPKEVELYNRKKHESPTGPAETVAAA